MDYSRNQTNSKKQFNIYFSIPIVLIIVLGIVLGGWQLKKYYFIEEVSQNLINKLKFSAAKSINEISSDKDAYFNVVQASGKYLNDKEIFIYQSREYNNTYKSSGYILMTPLKLSTGKVIMVARGWIPTQYRHTYTRPHTLKKGIETIKGIALPSQEEHLWSNISDLQNNIWFDVHLPKIASAIKENLADFYIIDDSYSNSLPPIVLANSICT